MSMTNITIIIQLYKVRHVTKTYNKSPVVSISTIK